VRQRNDENVQLFAERILTLGTEAYQGFRDDRTHEGLIEKQLVGFFIDGLNDDHLKVKLMRDNPQRLAEAVNTALMEQNLRKRFMLRSGRPTPINDYDNEPTFKFVKIDKQLISC